MDGWLCDVYTLKTAMRADVSRLRDCQVWLGTDGGRPLSWGEPLLEKHGLS